ncbi:UNVERIFIED_CONTAM: hypothetical protein HDU68_012891 [Siphonaria sp. JEL0065]|nr:hypothetical protein HDU68_012891 [Siphonaria sp. JEL0065]
MPPHRLTLAKLQTRLPLTPLCLLEQTARPKESSLAVVSSPEPEFEDPYISITGKPLQILPEGLLISSRTYAESFHVLRAHNVGFVVNVAVEVVNRLLEDSSSPDSLTNLQECRMNSECSAVTIGSTDDTPSMSPASVCSPLMDVIQDTSVTSDIADTDNQHHQQRSRYKKPEYIKIEWDHGSDIVGDLPQILSLIDDFLEKSKGTGKQVLVACNQGVSRSASLVIACVMRRRALGLMEAYEFVKERNEFISPNVGLLGQLAVYQESEEERRRQG